MITKWFFCQSLKKCIGPNCRRTPVACRQASLKAQYHFDCKCIICINPHEDNKFFKLYEGLLCLTCNHEINATLEDLNNSDKIYCDLCPVQFNTTDYKNRLTEANKLYNEGKILYQMYLIIIKLYNKIDKYLKTNFCIIPAFPNFFYSWNFCRNFFFLQS